MPTTEQVAEAKVNALIRLDVEESDVTSAAKVSHLFKKIPGGEEFVWELLEGSEHPQARMMIQKRALLNGIERDYCSFEAIATACHMTPRHAFGVVMELLVAHSEDMTEVILKSNMPAVIEKSVERALDLKDGTKDAKLLMTAGKLMPGKNNFTVVKGDQLNGQAVTKNQVAVAMRPEELSRRMAARFKTEMKVPDAIEAPVVNYADDEEVDDRMR